MGAGLELKDTVRKSSIRLHWIEKPRSIFIRNHLVSNPCIYRAPTSHLELEKERFEIMKKHFSRIPRESVVSCGRPPGKRTKIGPNISEKFLLTEEVLLPSVLNFYVHSPKTGPTVNVSVKTTTDVISFWVTLHILLLNTHENPGQTNKRTD